MTVQLNPYIHFDGNARQAMEFYHSVFGGKLTLQTFKEFGASRGPGDDDKIMHAQLDADHGLTLMAADTPMGQEYKPGTNLSISLSGEDEAPLKGYFDKLSAGGMVPQPLVKADWGDQFGICVDKFGLTWFVNITAPKP